MSGGMLETNAIAQTAPLPLALPVEPRLLFRDTAAEEPSVAAPAANLHSLQYEPQPWLRPHSLSELRLRCYTALLLIDVASIAIGFLIADLVRFGEPFTTVGLQYTVDFGAVFLAVAFSSGAYAVEVLEHPRKGLVRVLKALALASFVLLLGLFYTKTSAAMSRAVFGIGVVAATVFLVSARYAFGLRLGKRCEWKFQNEILLVDNALVAAGSGTALYAERFGISPYDNDPNFADRVGELLKGADHIVLACSPERRAPWLKVLKGVGVDVEVLTPELDQLGALGLRNTGAGAAVLVAAGPLGLRDRMVKRALDLTVAVALLVLLAPLMLLTAAAIKASSDGPVFFRQRRIGRGNHPFEVLKFRTMKSDACDANGARSVSRDDDRVTTVGAVLRQTSVDELPQLLNVLKGEMSIVGPRPHAVGSTAEDDFFWNIDDRYWQRGAVKPGITGLAQIRGFRGATGTRKDLTDRVQSDLEYLAEWSVWKDIAIILRTIRVVAHPNAF